MNVCGQGYADPMSTEITVRGRSRGAGKLSECRKCTAGMCSHGAQCPMMIRWYEDPWDGTFWRRCECTASIHAAVYPVTVGRVAKRC